MKKIFLLPVILLLAAGCGSGTINNYPDTTKTPSQNCLTVNLNLDQGYLDSYKNTQSAERSFTGILQANPKQSGADTLMRYLPYNLDGRNLYLFLNVDTYVGKKVAIKGKLTSYELEGHALTEIWPVSMCVYY
jgi:hypothetical protein